MIRSLIRLYKIYQYNRRVAHNYFHKPIIRIDYIGI